MPHTSIKRSALPLTLAAMAAGGSLASSPALAASAKTYTGPPVNFRWGTVRVSVVVKNKKITNVKTAYSVHTDRSQFITGNALPMLRQEVLRAQSAGIQLVSGASDTSQAYAVSLQSAVKKAIKAKKLPARDL